MSSSGAPQETEQRTNLLSNSNGTDDDNNNKQEDILYFDDKKNDEDTPSTIVDDERQTYILSNYSTLRTNLQWNNKIIQSIINKISLIKILPPSLRFEECVASKEKFVLQQELEHLLNTDIVESSCKSIINHVEQTALKDPLLSMENNPFIGIIYII